ncbi:MAG: hypothetical protein KUG82_02580 [Pseudomonadales bacterium]|nr:hypothetical protein [Pseudomonadales bacterium]
MELTCRCGNFSIDWVSKKLEYIARQCSCDYCKSSKAEFLSDPESTVYFKVRLEKEHKIIKHGHETSEFHECIHCGVIIITSRIYGDDYCVLNGKSLDIPNYRLDPILRKYDGETVEERLQRRQKNWCKLGANI